MPRLEDNPSYKHAAQLAKAGPETWQSWMGALGALKDMFFAATADAPVGSVLRLAGTGVPRTQQSLEQDIEDTILNYSFPGGSNIGGVIKGLKPAIRKAKPGARELRSVMAEEFRARGKTPSQAAGSDPKWFGDLLRGTAYHAGRYERFPNIAQRFNPANFRAGNIGEPLGISLTYHPQELYGEGRFVKRPLKASRAEDRLSGAKKKLWSEQQRLETEYRQAVSPTIKEILVTKDRNLANTRAKINYTLDHALATSPHNYPFTRVMPRFYTNPEAVVVKGWIGGGDDQLLKDAYVYALQQMPDLWKIRRGYNPVHIMYAFPKWHEQRITEMTDIANEFLQNNNLLNAVDQVLYSQQKGIPVNKFDIARIQESELPLAYKQAILSTGENASFTPKKERLRALIDKIANDSITNNIPSTAPMIPNYGHLQDQLDRQSGQRLKFNGLITQYLQSKGKRGILYLPQRYNEYELKIFDPRDVVKLDERTLRNTKAFERMFEKSPRRPIPTDIAVPNVPKRMDTINEWAEEHGRLGYPNTSLGGVYSQIPLSDLTLQPEHIRKAQNEEVTLGALSQGLKSEQGGLRMGSEGRRQRGGARVGAAKEVDEFGNIPEFKFSPVLTSDDGKYFLYLDGDILSAESSKLFTDAEKSKIITDHFWTDPDNNMLDQDMVDEWLKTKGKNIYAPLPEKEISTDWPNTKLDPGELFFKSMLTDPMYTSPKYIHVKQGNKLITYDINGNNIHTLHEEHLTSIPDGEIWYKGDNAYSFTDDMYVDHHINPGELEALLAHGSVPKTMKGMTKEQLDTLGTLPTSISIKTPTTKPKIPL